MVWLIAFAMRAMMPRSASLPGIEDTDLTAFLRRLKREAEPVLWWALVGGALLHALTPALTIRLPVPAFLLSQPLLCKHTERLLAHRSYLLRQALYIVRLVAGMCWGADPQVRVRFALPPLAADPGTFRSS
jgi:hypothetical protein